MNNKPTLTHVDSFVVTGFCERTQNSDEFNPDTARIPKLWARFLASNSCPQSPIFGVYSEYETDANGYYTITAGIKESHILRDQHTIQVKAGCYLVFHGKGSMPMAVIATWQSVWQYFASLPTYQRTFDTDFETYLNADEVDIYIGVQDK